MGAEKGNKYYLMRSSSGRSKDFENPEELFEAFLEYLNWSENNPLYINDILRGGKDAGMPITIEKERPLSMARFASYLGMSDTGLENYGKLETHKDFFAVYARMKNICHTQKIERAEIGDYNANIVARVTQLSENVDHKSNGETIGTLPPIYLTTKNYDEKTNSTD